MRARLAVRITPADIGERVTVRARNHEGDASMIDVVGVLVDWQQATLTIERRDGELRQVRQADLMAGRVIPPAPPRPPRGPSLHGRDDNP